jgi:flagellar biosynthesis protein FlhA
VNRLSAFLRSGIGVPIVLLALLGMVIIPLPPFLLDVFFTFNIVLSMIVLMVVVYAKRPLEFAIFPTIILITALFRLALNIASTRVILLEGHEGGDAAGQVIQSFGEFVIGGNYAVGLVVFVILVVINFVVITKGAGRVAEVSARFSLDSMPGKQMAIDADLGAGLITQEEAQVRRKEVAAESEFYGSMDGASKFVRGDAIAGIIITFINILGGFAIGIAQHNMAAGDAAQVFTILTIGDGLVAQVPSLILSVAAAIIITRASGSREELGEQVRAQMFSNPRVLAVTAGVMATLGIIPGMPNVAFLLLASSVGAVAWILYQKEQALLRREEPLPDAMIEEITQDAPLEELSWESLASVDMLGLEVGYRLIPLVDANQNGQLLSRVRGIRKKLSQDLGFLIDPVHIRDNLELSPSAYRITLLGVPMGEAKVEVDKELAINPGQVFGEIEGTATKDPTFGLQARWISPALREQAQSMGYTVVDVSTVVATHVSQIIQDYAHELLGHEQVQELLNRLKETSPKLVEEAVPSKLSLVTLVKVLQGLLQDGVPIRDMRTIMETLAERAQTTQDVQTLLMHVRNALGRMIVQDLVGIEGDLPVITLEPSLEQLLIKSAQQSGDGVLGIEPGLAQKIHQSLQTLVDQQEMKDEVAVLVVAPQVRQSLARLLHHSLTGLSVLAYSEIPETRSIRVVGTVGQS